MTLKGVMNEKLAKGAFFTFWHLFFILFSVIFHVAHYSFQEESVIIFNFSYFSLGIYDTATTFGWTKDKNGNMSFWHGYFWGGLSGSLGIFILRAF